jgi:DNA-binding response OmpR family regulator
MQNEEPTVIVIDNSPAIMTLFERSTEKLGINLKIFGSAEESWSYLESNKPDLLILSIKDGLIFLQELRNTLLHQDTPVVMVSSTDYAQDRVVADELGALEFIPKPMPMKTIEDVVVKYTKAKPRPE